MTIAFSFPSFPFPSLPPAHFLGSASGHKHVRNLLPEALGLEDGGQGRVQMLQGSGLRSGTLRSCPCHGFSFIGWSRRTL